MVLSVQNADFCVMCFLLTAISNNGHIHLGFLTSTEQGPFGCDVIISSDIIFRSKWSTAIKKICLRETNIQKYNFSNLTVS